MNKFVIRNTSTKEQLLAQHEDLGQHADGSWVDHWKIGEKEFKTAWRPLAGGDYSLDARFKSVAVQMEEHGYNIRGALVVNI